MRGPVYDVPPAFEGRPRLLLKAALLQCTLCLALPLVLLQSGGRGVPSCGQVCGFWPRFSGWELALGCSLPHVPVGVGDHATLSTCHLPLPNMPLPSRNSLRSNALTGRANWPAQVRLCDGAAACSRTNYDPTGPFLRPQTVHYNGVNYTASYNFTLFPASLSDDADTQRSESASP